MHVRHAVERPHRRHDGLTDLSARRLRFAPQITGEEEEEVGVGGVALQITS